MKKSDSICWFFTNVAGQRIMFLFLEKKEDIWLSPMTKASKPTEKIQKATWQHKKATKNFDNTTIADRLRTVSKGNDSHPTGC